MKIPHVLTTLKKRLLKSFRIKFLPGISLMLFSQLAFAQTSITNDITVNTTWDLVNSPYSIDAAVNVATGVTLTIDPGVTVTFASNGTDLTIDGTLIADGGPGTDTIRFQNSLASVFLSSSSVSSIIDHARFETMGVFNVAALNISSNGVAVTNSKFVDNEVGITVLAGATPIIQDCEMISSNDYGIRVDDGSPTISGTLIDGDNVTNSAGIWIQSGTPSITNCTFQNTLGVGAVWIDNSVSVPTLDNNTFTGNVRDLTTHPMLLDDTYYDNNGLTVIHVDPRNVTANTTWHQPQGGESWVYEMVFGDITVEAGNTLTIEPGVEIVYTSNGQDLFVDGILDASGTVSDSIRIRDGFATIELRAGSGPSVVDYLRMDGMGAFNVAGLVVSSSDATITNSKFVDCEVGVTVLSGTSPTIQDCEFFSSSDYGIRVDNGSPAITNVLIDGDNEIPVGGIWIQQGTPSITNSTIQNTGNSGGIWVNTTDIPTIDNNTFSGNTRDILAHPMVLDDTNFDNNGISTVYIDNANITGNTTWHQPVLPESWNYVVTSALTVDNGATLTIEPGVDIQFTSNGHDLTINGTLNATGTAVDSIRLTGGFATVLLTSSSTGSVLDYVKMEQMGAFNVAGLLISSDATIDHSKFSLSEVGITVNNNVSAVIQNSEFYDFSDYGIQIDNGSSVISNVIVDGNGGGSGGIWIQDGTPSITGSTLQNTNGFGILIDAAVVPTIDGNSFSGNVQDLIAHPEILDDENFDNNGLSLVHIDNKAVTTNTTWQKAQAPESWVYGTTGAFSVDPGINLTIEPGVEIQFGANSHDLTVNGTLVAQGTVGDPIYFNSGGASVFLSSSSTGSIFDYVRMEQMGVFNVAALAISSDATISNSFFDQNEVGISVDNAASPTIVSTVIKNSTDYGMLVTDGSPSVSASAIYDNPTGINNTGGGIVNALSNWWGDITGPTHASNPSGLGDVISDNVTYVPFLTENLLEPQPPSDLQTTEVSATQIDLSWSDNSSNESGFLIERSDGNNSSFTPIVAVGPDVTSWTETTVSADNGYFYRLQAFTGIAFSDYSNEKFGSTLTPPGNGLQFDGVDDEVNFSDPLLTTYSDFTIEFWVKIPVTNSGQVNYFEQSDPAGGSTPQIVIAATFNNTMYMFLRETNNGTTALVQGSTQINDDTWHHLAYAREGTELRVYVDGVLDGTAAAFAGDIVFPASATSKLEGDATLDEFRLWNTALDESAILTSSLNVQAGNEANLISYYRFDQDEITDLTLPDRSVSHNHGTWSGSGGVSTPQWVTSNVPIPRPVVSIFQGTDNTGAEISNLQAIPVNFGHTPQSVIKSLEFAIENTGSEDLIISDIVTTGDFTVSTATSFTVATGTTENFTLDMLALTPGIANGTVTIQSNDPDFIFPVTGTKGILLPKAYWTDETGTSNDEIDRVDLSGANGQNGYYSGFSVDIKGIAIDTENNMVFWTNTDGQIRCGRIGDSGFTATNTVLDESGGSAVEFMGVDVDGASGKVYWCDATNGQIRKISFDGSNPEVLITVGTPRDIELDLINEKMYYSAGTEIFQANLDGSGVVSLYDGGSWSQYGVALDVAANRIFWIEDDEGIYNTFRADLDGSNISVIGSGGTPFDIETDPSNQRIYLTDPSTPEIFSLDYDGANFSSLQSGGTITNPQYLALDTRTMSPLNVVSVDPPGNGVSISADTDIVITFDGDVDPFTVNNSAIVVIGDQSGLINGSLTGGGTNTITFNPATNFKAGEKIQVSVTDLVKGTGGGSIVSDHYSDFIVAANLSPNIPPLLQEATIYSDGTNTGVDRLVAVDMDMDGDMDLAAIYDGVDTGIAWYENDGTQQFTRNVVATPVISDSQSVLAADLDSDGDIDLMGAFNGALFGYINDGSFGFTENFIAQIGVGHGINDMRIADMDGDGDLDIVAMWLSNPNNLHRIVWYEKIDASLYSLHTMEADINLPIGVEVADVDQDGDIDILAGGASGEVAWYENDGEQGFTSHTFASSLTSQYGGFTIGDFDGDGLPDMAMSTTTQTSWFVNDGTGNFTENVISASIGGNDLHSADLDGDGDMDLIGGANASIRFFENDGAGNFTIRTTSTSTNVQDVFITDLDSDGDLDVIAGGQSSRVAWFENAGVFAPEIEVFVGADNSGAAITHAQVTAVDIGSAAEPNDIIQTFAIENTGTSVLTISSITSTATEYTISGAPASVGIGGTETFTITLDGTAPGTFGSTIAINNDDSDENPFTFPITGEITSSNLPPDIIYIFHVEENSPTGLLIGTVVATDPEMDPVTYSILSGNTNGAFAIGSSSGDITIADELALDYEITPVFNLIVQADDGNDGISTVGITINLIDIDEDALGISDLESKINVYPNPVRDRLSIELDKSLSGGFEISLFSVSGSRVLIKSMIRKIGNDKIEMDLQGIKPGIYLLKIKNEKDVVTKNILVR
ncbi:MAG: FG-GAP-like repeat-containing protein [Cyclobacteriaceae bacterium]